MMRWLIVIFLMIDIICVGFEILFDYRIIPPSFHTDTYSGTLYVPSNYVCADSSTVTSENLLIECCKDYNAMMLSASQFASTSDCFNAHFNHTVLTSGSSSSSSSSSSNSGTHRRRYLLSTVAHGPALPHCYSPPHRFTPHRTHYPAEMIAHWLSFTILVFFAIELGCSLYVFGFQQFFCSCYRKLEKGDLVNVYEQPVHEGMTSRTIKGTGGIKPKLRRGKVDHRNEATGDIDIMFTDNNELVRDLPRPLIFQAEGEKKRKILWHHFPHVLDFIVVYISLIFEIIYLNTDLLGILVVHFLISFRLLRFVRVIHGIYEGKNHLKHEISSQKEYESDTRWYFSQIQEELKKLKLDKNPSEEGQEIYDLRRSLRHIKVFLEEFQEEFPEHKDKKGHSMSFKNVLKAQVMKQVLS